MSRDSKIDMERVNNFAFARCSDIVKINAVLGLIHANTQNSTYQIKKDMNEAYGLAPNTTGRILGLLEDSGVIRRLDFRDLKKKPSKEFRGYRAVNFLVVNTGFMDAISLGFKTLYGRGR